MSSTATTLLEEADFLRRSGALAQAAERYQRHLAADPDSVEALLHLARFACQDGRIDDGVALLRRALAVDPRRANAHSLLGLALLRLGRAHESLASFEAAIACEPGLSDAGRAEALGNRGDALAALGRPAEALTSYDRALALDPAAVETWCNRGAALQELRRHAEAVASYDRALALRPDFAEVHLSRGGALARLERYEDAIAAYDRALALVPLDAGAHADRAAVLAKLKRYETAIAGSERALALDPAHPRALGELAACSVAICDWPRAAPLPARFAVRFSQGELVVSPFVLLGLADDPALLRAAAQSYVAGEIPRQPALPRQPRKEEGGRIRIAYLSADFRHHATAFLTARLFERHDRERFEVIALSSGADDGSAMRARLVRAFDRFIEVGARPDREVAELIVELGVDIAVDLKGHTEGARLGVLAYRPSPVQVSYLGYPGTTGADFIDYVIADEVVLPPALERHFTEAVVRLPDSYQVNDSTREIAPVAPPREALGLPADGFVFCCFNHAWKITAEVFEVWMRLLRAVEGSVLWLFQTNDAASTRLLRAAQARGVDPVRLVFAPLAALPDHLARLQRADLFLDTLPCNAHTTASDALWAGVPLVTCMGASFAARVAASLLHATGVPELVTDNLAAYEARALALAADPVALAAIRRRLADSRAACPLFDTDQFRRHVEAAYVQMWQIHRRGERPQGFRVDAIEARAP